MDVELYKVDCACLILNILLNWPSGEASVIVCLLAVRINHFTFCKQTKALLWELKFIQMVTGSWFTFTFFVKCLYVFVSKNVIRWKPLTNYWLGFILNIRPSVYRTKSKFPIPVWRNLSRKTPVLLQLNFRATGVHCSEVLPSENTGWSASPRYVDMLMLRNNFVCNVHSD